MSSRIGFPQSSSINNHLEQGTVARPKKTVASCQLQTKSGKEYLLTAKSTGSQTLGVTVHERGTQNSHYFNGPLQSLPKSIKDIFMSGMLNQGLHASKFLCSNVALAAGLGALQSWAGNPPCQLQLQDPIQKFEVLPELSELEKTSAAEAYQEVLERFNSPEPVTKNEVDKMYQRLFGESLKEESLQHLDERNHPASIVHSLHEVISHFLQSPDSAKVSTGDDAGQSGSYWLKTSEGERAWIFKPEREEAGAEENPTGKRVGAGITPGQGAKREHVADLVNQSVHGFFRVPKTVYIELDGQVGSAQAVVPNIGSVHKHRFGTPNPDLMASLSPESVQGVTLADTMAFINLDRHEENLLIRGSEEEGTELIAIDQGGTLSADPKDPLKVNEIHLSQNAQPILDSVREQALNAPVEEWAKIYRKNGIDEKAVKIMLNHAAFVQAAVGASEQDKQAGGPGLEMRDIAFMARELHEDIANAGESTLQELATFITCFKSGLHQNTLDKRGLLFLKAQGKGQQALNKLGLKHIPVMGADAFAQELRFMIMDPYMARKNS